MTPAEMVRTGPLVLVNQSHPLAQEPTVASLLPPDSRRPNILLDARAGTVLSRFLSDLGCAGEIVPLILISPSTPARTSAASPGA